MTHSAPVQSTVEGEGPQWAPSLASATATSATLVGATATATGSATGTPWPTTSTAVAPDVSPSQYWLRSLETRDFRNLVAVSLTLPPEGIVVVGDNGHGKTNLLEAIAYLHLLRSVRGVRDREVVRFGGNGFTIRGSVALERIGESGSIDVLDHEIVVGFEGTSKRKRVTVDQLEPERLSDALGTLPAVTFSVTDVDLVRGAPSGRRRYLDVALATTSRRYLSALQTYRAALTRRNAALRASAGRSSSAAANAALGAWEPALASSGATLWAERSRWTAQWAPEFARVSAAIGERGVVEMRYVPRLPDEREDVREGAAESVLAVALQAALEADRMRDIRRGATRAGPHRDDLVLTIDGRALRAYGSAGQQRSAAIGLRILESYTLRDRGGASPMLLFDDPFAELDERRARAVLEVLGGATPGAAALGQVVLAVPRAADIPVGLTRLARYGIADGALSRGAA